MRTLALALVAGCWAPTVAPPQEEIPRAASDDEATPPVAANGAKAQEPPAPGPTEPAAHAVPHTPETSPASPPSPTDLSPLPEVLSVRPARYPAVPFTAWTTRAPLDLKREGADPLHLDRLGVRVEVLAVDEDGLSVVCTGCTGPAAGARGRLARESVHPVGVPGSNTDPLALAMRLRARWSSGADLPAGASNRAMCVLVDHGFVLEGDTARWQADGGTLVLGWDGERWTIREISPAWPHGDGDCRIEGLRPPDGGGRYSAPGGKHRAG